MKALIVGGGGREHALAWKLKQDDPSIELLAAPGNPGIAELARCVAVSASDIGPGKCSITSGSALSAAKGFRSSLRQRLSTKRWVSIRGSMIT